MIRAFAWWGISRSTSSGPNPDFSSSCRHAFDISTTARLKTSRPFGIWIAWSFASTEAWLAGSAEPPPGMIRISAARPSAPRTEPSTPGSSERRSTTAPAPSPNSTQVVRSWKFITRDRTSAPITTTVSACPDSMKAVAVDIA